ncbi:MAG: hypothetical protein AAGB93_03710 [Planctomycetota bacterium]
MASESPSHPVLSRMIGGTSYVLGVLLVLFGLVFFGASASGGFTHQEIDFEAGTVRKVLEWGVLLKTVALSCAFGAVGVLMCVLGARILSAVQPRVP